MHRKLLASSLDQNEYLSIQWALILEPHCHDWLNSEYMSGFMFPGFYFMNLTLSKYEISALDFAELAIWEILQQIFIEPFLTKWK